MEISKMLEQFHDIASSPRKQLDHYLNEGRPVVGCVPVYTPEELVHAMGMVPFGVWGADVQLKESKQYFPAFICSIMQSVLELGMAGKYQGLSALIIPSLCDSLKCLGQNWKYAVKDIPFIPMTYPQNRSTQAGRAFAKAGYQRVIAELEQLTKKTFDPKALKKSIRIYNEHNQIMRQLSTELARHPSVTAAQRRDIFKSAFFMLKEEHTALVRAFLDTLALVREIGEAPKKRVITSGILADSDGLLRVFDEHKIQIVGDDIAHESRQYRTDIPESGDPLEALVTKFADMGGCSVLYDPDKRRADLLVKMAQAADADGVVLVLTKFCDPEEFDYVIIKKACEDADIPLLQIEADRQMDNYEQAATMLQTFTEI